MQPGDVQRTWADITRSKSELDYAPQTSLREGIAQQWAYMAQFVGASEQEYQHNVGGLAAIKSIELPTY